MLTWPCDYPGCQLRSIPQTGDCRICYKRLCKIHAFEAYHPCLELDEDERDARDYANSEAARTELLEIVRNAHLDKIASSMRNGHDCTIDIPNSGETILEGGVNLHLILTFDDGKKWCARIRKRNILAPTSAIRSMEDQSEIASMKILNRITNGIVPMVYEIPSDLQPNTDGLDFFYMDFVPGKPLNAPILNGEETPEQMDQAVHDYALFQISLKSLSFDAIGSLYPASSNFTPEHGDHPVIVGPLLSLHLRFDEPPHFIGPFKSNKERYLWSIDLVLRKVIEGVFHPEAARYVYLAHLELKDMVNRFDKWDTFEDGKFYFKHGDDKGDHIMVDENGHITGILDWEWAYVTSKAEGFACCDAFMNPKVFWDGDNSLSRLELKLIEEYEALGHSDLGDCVRHGRIYQRLEELVGRYPDLDFLNSIRELLSSDDISFADSDDYVEWAHHKYGNDTQYQELLTQDES
ncbi:hypothetical protein V865_003512 [Kwoniella europaea PYCC6329]|uniref:Aminoglycoside phosphotransferase domain-containing protein n=1 Tax=Kwoniella europaea PYCC6329 TaxID=1423913 RepID=A0AAX4KGB5_9TREE